MWSSTSRQSPSAYDRWAPVYDLVFGAVFERGRDAAIEAAERVGGRILGSASAPASRCPTIHRHSQLLRHRYLRTRCCSKAQERVTELGLEQRRRPLGDGRRALTFPGRFVRRRGRAICRDYRAQSGSDARRVRAGAEAGRRDHPGQPRRRRSRPAARARTLGSRRWRASSAGAPSFRGSATRWVAGRDGIRLIERRAMPPLGHFSLIRFGKTRPAAELERAGTPAHVGMSLIRDYVPYQTNAHSRGLRWTAFLEALRDPALGRSSLLPPQPHQPVAAPAQRDQLSLAPMLLLFTDPVPAALIGWLVAMTSRQVGHFFFEPKGYDDVNQATHEYKEDDQGRLQPAPQGRAACDLGAVAAAAVSRSRRCSALFEPHTTIDRVRPSTSARSGSRSASAACCSAPCTCSSSGTCRPGLVWVTKILTDPFHDIKLYYRAPLLPAARRADRSDDARHAGSAGSGGARRSDLAQRRRSRAGCGA